MAKLERAKTSNNSTGVGTARRVGPVRSELAADGQERVRAGAEAALGPRLGRVTVAHLLASPWARISMRGCFPAARIHLVVAAFCVSARSPRWLRDRIRRAPKLLAVRDGWRDGSARDTLPPSVHPGLSGRCSLSA